METLYLIYLCTCPFVLFIRFLIYLYEYNESFGKVMFITLFWPLVLVVEIIKGAIEYFKEVK